jgi:hypothetical protein
MKDKLESSRSCLPDYESREVLFEGCRVLKMNCGVCGKEQSRYCYEPLKRVSICSECGVVRSICDLEAKTSDLLPMRMFWEGFNLLKSSLSLQHMPSSLALSLGLGATMDDPLKRALGLSYAFVPSLQGFAKLFLPTTTLTGKRKWFARPVIFAPIVSSPGNLIGLRIVVAVDCRRNFFFSSSKKVGYVYLNFAGADSTVDLTMEEEIVTYLPEIIQRVGEYRLKVTRATNRRTT